MSTYKKRAGKQLTANFKSNEFDCKCGWCEKTVIDSAFVKLLQAFRDYLAIRTGKNPSITVHSGYRCPAHNREVGGSATSKHMRGMAADVSIRFDGILMGAKTMCGMAQDFGQFRGIELINETRLHVDNRTTAKWYAEKLYTGKYATFSDFYKRFGLKRTDKCPYEHQSSALRRGYKGEDVKWLQWHLFCLGYYAGAVDGSFGTQTQKAVKAFQKARKLKVDGICGPDTRKAIVAVW